MEIGLGIDSRFALNADDQRTIAREAAELGYTSLWTPIGDTRERFDICVAWHDASGLPTGIAVAPVSAWPIEKLASIAKETLEGTQGHFILGIGTGRTADAPIRVMREAIDALRAQLPGASVYLGALGPQMLRLAGERYDGAALNWCSIDQVRWSRERVAAGAVRAGREPSDVRIHEYIRICVDEEGGRPHRVRHHGPDVRTRAARSRQDEGLPRPLRAHGLRSGADGPRSAPCGRRRRAGACANLPGRPPSTGRLLGSTRGCARSVSAARIGTRHRGGPSGPGAPQRARRRSPRDAGLRARLLADLLRENDQIAQ